MIFMERRVPNYPELLNGAVLSDDLARMLLGNCDSDIVAIESMNTSNYWLYCDTWSSSEHSRTFQNL